MFLSPKESLSERDIQKGLKIVIWDGLAAEAMTVFSSGTFLVSMALLLGADSIQIGLLAALPLATNVFQLVSVWLVGRYHNRRMVAVLCAYLARIPLLLVGFSVLFFSRLSLDLLIFMLFFHYLFGSIAGPSWNSWIKDMVPESMQDGLQITFSCRSSKERIFAEIDEDKFMQVINNLISNSLKFTPKNGNIDVYLTESKKQVLITVADNGIGIPKKYHATLFEKFTNARRNGLNGEQSTGLGMSIIKTIIEWHKGKIWFDSEENKGTTFYIELPKV